jgi:hypothetical protein
MKKVILFFLFFSVFNSFDCFSQDNKTKQLTIEQKLEKHKDTFQIQVKDSRQKPSIPFNIDEIIELNRKENEVSYVQLGTMVRIMILPKKEILKKRTLELFSTY